MIYLLLLWKQHLLVTVFLKKVQINLVLRGRTLTVYIYWSFKDVQFIWIAHSIMYCVEYTRFTLKSFFCSVDRHGSNRGSWEWTHAFDDCLGAEEPRNPVQIYCSLGTRQVMWMLGSDYPVLEGRSIVQDKHGLWCWWTCCKVIYWHMRRVCKHFHTVKLTVVGIDCQVNLCCWWKLGVNL